MNVADDFRIDISYSYVKIGTTKSKQLIAETSYRAYHLDLIYSPKIFRKYNQKPYMVGTMGSTLHTLHRKPKIV